MSDCVWHYVFKSDCGQWTNYALAEDLEAARRNIGQRMYCSDGLRRDYRLVSAIYTPVAGISRCQDA